MEIYRKLPEDIQHKFFMYFQHPNAETIRSKNHHKLMMELTKYNTFKQDIMERIIHQSYIKHYLDMRSIRFSYGWFLKGQINS